MNGNFEWLFKMIFFQFCVKRPKKVRRGQKVVWYLRKRDVWEWVGLDPYFMQSLPPMEAFSTVSDSKNNKFSFKRRRSWASREYLDLNGFFYGRVREQSLLDLTPQHSRDLFVTVNGCSMSFYDGLFWAQKWRLLSRGVTILQGIDTKRKCKDARQM